jgi:hypothetical protein
LFRDAADPTRSESGGVSGAPSDVTDIAQLTLAECAPDVPLDLVRSPHKGREAVAERRVMVRRMSAAGHLGTAIARYLRISAQAVSNILRAHGFY